MPVIGTCPNCGARNPLPLYLLEREAKEALQQLCTQLADAPEVIARVPAYLALHSPKKGAMSMAKTARIIRELAELVAGGQVAYNGEQAPVSPAIWAAAIDRADDARRAGRLGIPLEGHGWLRKVTLGIAQEQASQAKDRHAAALRGETPVGYSPAHGGAQPTAQPPVAVDVERANAMGELEQLRKLYAYGANPRLAAGIRALEERLGLPPCVLPPVAPEPRQAEPPARTDNRPGLRGIADLTAERVHELESRALQASRPQPGDDSD